MGPAPSVLPPFVTRPQPSGKHSQTSRQEWLLRRHDADGPGRMIPPNLSATRKSKKKERTKRRRRAILSHTNLTTPSPHRRRRHFGRSLPLDRRSWATSFTHVQYRRSPIEPRTMTLCRFLICSVEKKKTLSCNLRHLISGSLHMEKKRQGQPAVQPCSAIIKPIDSEIVPGIMELHVPIYAYRASGKARQRTNSTEPLGRIGPGSLLSNFIGLRVHHQSGTAVPPPRQVVPTGSVRCAMGNGLNC